MTNRKPKISKDAARDCDADAPETALERKIKRVSEQLEQDDKMLRKMADKVDADELKVIKDEAKVNR